MAIDEVFKALADPTRRRILRMLQSGDLSAGEIAQEFGIRGPSMSHHFNVLKHADLIEGKRDGQQIVYSLNTTVVQDMLAMFMDVMQPKKEPTGESQ